MFSSFPVKTLYRQTRMNPREGIETHYRLAVRSRDNDCFQNNIQQRGRLSASVTRPLAKLSDSRRRMLQNAGYFMEELAKYDE